MVITASILDSTPSPTRDESGSTPASSVPGSLLLHQHPRVPEIRQEGSSGVVAEQSTAITTGAAGGAEGAGGGGEPWARGGGANPRPPALRSGAARGLSRGGGAPPRGRIVPAHVQQPSADLADLVRSPPWVDVGSGGGLDTAVNRTPPPMHVHIWE